MVFNFPIHCVQRSDTPSQMHMQVQVQDVARANSIVEMKPLKE